MTEHEPAASQPTEDFDQIPRSDLISYAQELAGQSDFAGLRRLKDYVKKCQSNVPYNTMYSSEWDYWNYIYSISEIDKALEAESPVESD